MIKTQVDRGSNLTVFVCSGTLSFEELSLAVKEFYDAEPTLNIIWDLSEADTSGIETADVQNLARFADDLTHSRTGGKTALVAGEGLTFGLSRMYQTFSEFSNKHPAVQVFKTISAAERWLGS